MAHSEELKDILNRGFRYALALTHHEEDAFDLVQNAYLKICEQKKPLVIPYLIATIRNIHIDNARKKTTRFKWLNRQNNKKHYVQKFRVEPVLEQHLAQLKVRDRKILVLSVVEEYTAREISELLGISRNTVLTILSRTKKKLKSQLEEKSQRNERA